MLIQNPYSIIYVYGRVSSKCCVIFITNVNKRIKRSTGPQKLIFFHFFKHNKLPNSNLPYNMCFHAHSRSQKGLGVPRREKYKWKNAKIKMWCYKIDQVNKIYENQFIIKRAYVVEILHYLCITADARSEKEAC